MESSCRQCNCIPGARQLSESWPAKCMNCTFVSSSWVCVIYFDGLSSAFLPTYACFSSSLVSRKYTFWSFQHQWLLGFLLIYGIGKPTRYRAFPSEDRATLLVAATQRIGMTDLDRNSKYSRHVSEVGFVSNYEAPMSVSLFASPGP